ncbi:flagellar basal body L-ring protein FlgH [bacterium]|nr:flagellar basal body L-ring protein FlgH [bacterium]
MNRYSKILLFSLALLLPVLGYAQRFENVVNRSLFADKKAFQEGDILTILLMEFTEGVNETETNTNSDNRFEADANTSGTLGDLLTPFGIDSQLSNRSDNKGTTSSRGELRGKITATITEVGANGLVTIQGTRIVSVNGEEQTTVLTGRVRIDDIRPDNTIYSYNIAEAQILYRGSGVASEGGKPGFITRFINWIF